MTTKHIEPVDTLTICDQTVMCFDVESIGLHGEAFAVGWVVFDSNGSEKTSGCVACKPVFAKGNDDDRAWVAENVPVLPVTHDTPAEVRAAFWQVWQHWRQQGARLLCDCGWPVEARFLAACVDDIGVTSHALGPYPLLDVSTLDLLLGGDSAERTARTKDAYAHHPEHDARRSARRWKAHLATLFRMSCNQRNRVE